MNKYIQILRDAFLVGIMLIILGIPILFIFDKLIKNRSYYYYSIIFLLCGIIFYLICEFSGINKWYCKNGIEFSNTLENITLKNFNPEIINPAFIREKN